MGFQKIDMLVMDIDGSLTDGKIYMGEHGEVMKAFDIKDGYAIYHMLPQNGIVPVVITGRTSAIVENRCRELKIEEIHQGCLDKEGKIIEIAQRHGLEFSSDGKLCKCAYFGDDLIDLPAMKLVEVIGCPSDAAKQVKEMATYICERAGGAGALREFVEWLLEI